MKTGVLIVLGKQKTNKNFNDLEMLQLVAFFVVFDVFFTVCVFFKVLDFVKNLEQSNSARRYKKVITIISGTILIFPKHHLDSWIRGVDTRYSTSSLRNPPDIKKPRKIPAKPYKHLKISLIPEKYRKFHLKKI
jgi:hypothetical protein